MENMRDSFYFEKGKDGNPPSNYRSYFGGSALGEGTGNGPLLSPYVCKRTAGSDWENPKVKKELFDMINWWLTRGLPDSGSMRSSTSKKDVNFPSYEPDGPDGMCACTAMVERVDGIGEHFGRIEKGDICKERYIYRRRGL